MQTTSETESPLDHNDISEVRATFQSIARLDGLMDRQEYGVFARSLGLSDETARHLWITLDTSGDGVVDADEFAHGLRKMFRHRDRLRFCPACGFQHTCDYCARCARCPDCTREAYCVMCWREHPNKNKTGDENNDDKDNGVDDHAAPIKFSLPYRGKKIVLT